MEKNEEEKNAGMDKNETEEGAGQNKNEKEKNTGMAIVAYIIFFIPLLTDAKDDKFVKYHVRQGLMIFIAWIALSILGMIIYIPFISWFIIMILRLGVFILMIMGIMNAAQGEKKPLPLIGKWGEKINI